MAKVLFPKKGERKYRVVPFHHIYFLCDVTKGGEKSQVRRFLGCCTEDLQTRTDDDRASKQTISNLRLLTALSHSSLRVL